RILRVRSQWQSGSAQNHCQWGCPLALHFFPAKILPAWISSLPAHIMRCARPRTAPAGRYAFFSISTMCIHPPVVAVVKKYKVTAVRATLLALARAHGRDKDDLGPQEQLPRNATRATQKATRL